MSAPGIAASASRILGATGAAVDVFSLDEVAANVRVALVPMTPAERAALEKRVARTAARYAYFKG